MFFETLSNVTKTTNLKKSKYTQIYNALHSIWNDFRGTVDWTNNYIEISHSSHFQISQFEG